MKLILFSVPFNDKIFLVKKAKQSEYKKESFTS